MTSERQRIKLAEHRGWRILSMREATALGLYRPCETQNLDAWQQLYDPCNKKIAGTEWQNKEWGSLVNLLPNYLNDLTAAHSLLEGLTEEQGRQFMLELYNTFERKYEAFEFAAGEPVLTAWFLFRAKPPEICDAYLHAFGLWEDEA